MDLPPLHPILVNFTAALVPVSVASDVLGRMLRRRSLHATGWWTLLYAALATPFTALAGWLWLRSMGDMDHPGMAVHQWLGTALAAGLAPLVLWRGWLYRKDAVPPVTYLVVAGVLLAALVYQGHLGGTMSFGEGEAAPVHDHAPASAPGQSGAGGHQHGIEWRDHIDLP